MYYVLYLKKDGKELGILTKSGTLQMAEQNLNNVCRGLIKNNREKDIDNVGIWKKVK
jgi:hypothetical protein